MMMADLPAMLVVIGRDLSGRYAELTRRPVLRADQRGRHQKSSSVYLVAGRASARGACRPARFAQRT